MSTDQLDELLEETLRCGMLANLPDLRADTGWRGTALRQLAHVDQSYIGVRIRTIYNYTLIIDTLQPLDKDEFTSIQSLIVSMKPYTIKVGTDTISVSHLMTLFLIRRYNADQLKIIEGRDDPGGSGGSGSSGALGDLIRGALLDVVNSPGLARIYQTWNTNPRILLEASDVSTWEWDVPDPKQPPTARINVLLQAGRRYWPYVAKTYHPYLQGHLSLDIAQSLYLKDLFDPDHMLTLDEVKKMSPLSWSIWMYPAWQRAYILGWPLHFGLPTLTGVKELLARLDELGVMAYSEWASRLGYAAIMPGTQYNPSLIYWGQYDRWQEMRDGTLCDVIRKPGQTRSAKIDTQLGQWALHPEPIDMLIMQSRI